MKKMKKMYALCTALLLVLPARAGAYPNIGQDQTFIFNYQYKKNQYKKTAIPDAYKLLKTVGIADLNGNMAASPSDFFVTAAGDLYVLDMTGGRIFLYDRELRLVRVIDTMQYPSGAASPLNKPEGLFVSGSGELYIADTQNQRVLKANADGEILSETWKPEVFTGVEIETFLPVKIAVDSTGRQSVIARNLNMGIAQFDSEGNFLGYIGAPKVKVDLVTKFWQLFSTKEQKAKMNRFVPTEYSNIAIDGEGFLYAATEKIAENAAWAAAGGGSALATALPVKRLNTVGKDILKRNGLTPPMGNIDTEKKDWVSRISDVAVGPAGSYTLLDSRTATLYTYSEEGVLLHAFGERGKGKNQFASPVAVDYQGNNILVLDAGLKSILVFSPTEYGAMLIDAINAEYAGDFEAAYALWGSAVRLNANFAYAYTGLGKTAYEKGDYRISMEYFANALDDADYSRAKEKRRTETMRTIFPFLFFGVVFLILFFLMKNFFGRIMSFPGRKA
ncbi:hypothetical protein FACS1894141_5080 [Spirochaetia bacterium]|nr:hypothetical protein FACS1894141_5080 [Spirochaetia bacterium]